MIRGLLKIGAGLIVAAVVSSQSALALPFVPVKPVVPMDGGSLQFGQRVVAPFAIHPFCAQYASECRVRRGRIAVDASGAVIANDRTLAAVRNVHSVVNSTIQPVSDKVQFGTADVWRVNTRKGDCEDYALEKRRRLIAMGWPSSALLLGIGTNWYGESHAILIVRTTNGELVLDNQKSGVVSLQNSGVSLQMIQSSRSPRQFFSLKVKSPAFEWFASR